MEPSQQDDSSPDAVPVQVTPNEAVRQETRDFFAQAAARYNPQAFADALAAVPDTAPVKGDEI